MTINVVRNHNIDWTDDSPPCIACGAAEADCEITTHGTPGDAGYLCNECFDALKKGGHTRLQRRLTSLARQLRKRAKKMEASAVVVDGWAEAEMKLADHIPEPMEEV